MWFTYDENPITWHKLSVDSVKEIIDLNKKGEEIEELEEYAIVSDLSSRKNASGYTDMELTPIEEDSITRFDTPKRKKKRNNKKGNKEKEALPKERNSIKMSQKLRLKQNAAIKNLKKCPRM